MGFEGAFQDLPPAQQIQWTATLTHMSLPLGCCNPRAVAYYTDRLYFRRRRGDAAIAENMVGILGIGASRAYRLRSRHFPNLSMPGEVAGIIGELAD